MSFFNQKIDILPGVGQRNKQFYNHLGICTLRDVLFFLPVQYLNLSKSIKSDILIAVHVKIMRKRKINNGFFKVWALIDEELIILNLYNLKHYNMFFVNGVYNISGIFRKTVEDATYNLQQLRVLHAKQTSFVIYANSVSSYGFQKLVNSILDQCPINETIIHNLSLKDVFYNLHHGVNIDISLYALKYLEAFFLKKNFMKQEEYFRKSIDLDSILAQMPYVLSKEQLRVCFNIKLQLESKHQMNYLLYGEVGSGKTLLAILSALMVRQMGFSVVLLAPTLALANQHYKELISIVNESDCLLYTSSLKQKKQVKEEIANGMYKIIVATHALLYLESVPNLGLVIIDEMHKFGVVQRGCLIKEAVRKNLFMLSATPIPRSLAMMLAGFIKYDVLPSYQPKQIETYWIKSDNMEALLSKLAFKKVYWVMPKIEDGDSIGVVSRYEHLKRSFENVFLLHGKLKDSVKLDVIAQFQAITHGILVATTIIEIGINIPDADLIVVESAEKFGLAQLHQLRGRVGRNGQKAFCFLLTDVYTQKIKYMKTTIDCEDIADKDLDLRKSGRLTGVVQHGCPAFYFLEEDDVEIFKLVSNENKDFVSCELFDAYF